MTVIDSCRLCGCHNPVLLVNFGEHPIAHHFLTDPSKNEYIHPVRLCFCESCGLIQLANPVPPDLLYAEYNWLSSWKLQPHIARLVQMIESMPGIARNSRIVEIGSNDGSFLEVLGNRGFQKLLGVEPAKDAQNAAKRRGLETVGCYFIHQTAEDLTKTHGKCDLLVARQVLEHIGDLEEFSRAMRTILAPGGYVLVEVPNFALSLAAPDYSVIWEEHINYFTPETLQLFLANAGVQVLHSETAVFSGEALIVVGQYMGERLPVLSSAYLGWLKPKVFAYRDRWPTFHAAMHEYLQLYQERGGKVAVYGAGCRANSLINFVALAPYIEFIVDDQLERQGKYMPGSRLPILPGDALEKHAIDLCLLAVNAESEEKVIAKHRAYEAKGKRFTSLLPPSDRLLELWHRF